MNDQSQAEAIRLLGEKIDRLAAVGADALTQAFLVENNRETTAQIVASLEALRVENAALRRDLTTMMMRPEA